MSVRGGEFRKRGTKKEVIVLMEDKEHKLKDERGRCERHDGNNT